jgi:hypothetical protein
MRPRGEAKGRKREREERHTSDGGTDREEETERRDRGEETEGKRQRGRDRGEIHRRKDIGKETEGNRHRERDRGEQTQGKRQRGTGMSGERAKRSGRKRGKGRESMKFKAKKERESAETKKKLVPSSGSYAYNANTPIDGQVLLVCLARLQTDNFPLFLRKKTDKRQTSVCMMSKL